MLYTAPTGHRNPLHQGNRPQGKCAPEILCWAVRRDRNTTLASTEITGNARAVDENKGGSSVIMMGRAVNFIG